MELRQLRYAAEVAKHQSFSRAAEALFVTQQTLSQQIRRLEDELGFPLFARSTRKVALTEKGAVLLREAERVLAALDALEREAAALRESPAAS